MLEPRGAAEEAIVSALARYTQRTAPQLRELTGLGVHTLYPALYRLEESGAVQGEWVEGPAPRLRRYKLAE